MSTERPIGEGIFYNYPLNILQIIGHKMIIFNYEHAGNFNVKQGKKSRTRPRCTQEGATTIHASQTSQCSAPSPLSYSQHPLMSTLY